MTTVSKSKWVESLLSPDQVAKVSEAVKRAEVKTSGEIVPMIVRRSSAIGHIRLVVALLWLLLLATLDIVGTTFAADLTVWFYEKFAADFTHVMVGVTGVGALLTIPVAYYLSLCAGVQRRLTPSADLDAEVLERAQLEFYWANLTNTEGRTGILIFLSLMERKCVVLADEGISKLLPKETWDEVVKTVIDGIQQNRASEGLIEAIALCGKILAVHFPPTAANPNELPNQLVIKE